MPASVSAARVATLVGAFDRTPASAAKELNSTIGAGLREGMENSFRASGHTAAEAAAVAAPAEPEVAKKGKTDKDGDDKDKPKK